MIFLRKTGIKLSSDSDNSVSLIQLWGGFMEFLSSVMVTNFPGSV